MSTPVLPIAARMRPRFGSEAKKDRKSTRLNSSHITISYAVFCLKKKKLPHSAARTGARARVAAQRARPDHDADRSEQVARSAHESASPRPRIPQAGGLDRTFGRA